MITGDETLLNHKGYLSPSHSTETDISDLTEIEIGNYKSVNNKQVGWDLDLSVTDDNGTRNYTSKGLEPLDITKNYFINMFETNKQYTFSADKNTKFKLSVNVPPDEQTTDGQSIELFQQTENCSRHTSSLEFDKDTEIELGENYMSRYASNYSAFVFELRTEEGAFKDDGFYTYGITGSNVGTVTMFEREDGILFTTDQQFDGWVYFSGLIYNEDGSVEAFRTEGGKHTIIGSVVSTNNVMFRYDKADDRIAIFIDDNNDDVYDRELEKGDANCDGIIDGRDASLVLSAYAEQSVYNYLYCDVNEYYCDMDENGIIDARDASAVLTSYAKASVSSSK